MSRNVNGFNVSNKKVQKLNDFFNYSKIIREFCWQTLYSDSAQKIEKSITCFFHVKLLFDIVICDFLLIQYYKLNMIASTAKLFSFHLMLFLM